jgi:hypothetical protein
MKNKIVILLLAICVASCNKFLDVMPDNRSEVDTIDKIERLLRSAYAGNGNYFFVSEWTSDNIDMVPALTVTDNAAMHNEFFFWEESRTTHNDAPDRIWDANYLAIATANLVLQSIEEMGGATTPRLRAAKGEALVTRAYHHFILVNVFSQHFSSIHSGSDLGIPYITAPETMLNPIHERPSVAYVYEMINRDLQEGLPLITDAFLVAPKFRFNQRAAYTFASRFYLYKGEWDSVIKYSSLALGENPQAILRDWDEQFAFGPINTPAFGLFHSRAQHNTNFLLQTPPTNMGLFHGSQGFNWNNRFAHTSMIAYYETTRSTAPWGPRIQVPGVPGATPPLPAHMTYKVNSLGFQGGIDKVLFCQIPYIFEFTDPIAGIGFRRAVLILFCGEEALLNRAEAYIMTNQFEEALDDINLWVQNIIRPPDARPATQLLNLNLTEADLAAWESGIEYFTPLQPTQKKKLNPDFALSTRQTTFMHTMLYIRRIEFMGRGKRLFDVKRYGIEIERRMIAGTGMIPPIVGPTGDPLTTPGINFTVRLPPLVSAAGEPNITLFEPRLIAEKRSPRLVIQIPPAVIAAGLVPNPHVPLHPIRSAPFVGTTVHPVY